MERTSSSARNTDMTVILYKYGDCSITYKSRLPGKNITLGQFKDLIHRKGNFRYFFKTYFHGFGFVYEEASNDNEVLPLYEDKIFGVMEMVDSSSDDELIVEAIKLGLPSRKKSLCV